MSQPITPVLEGGKTCLTSGERRRSEPEDIPSPTKSPTTIDTSANNKRIAKNTLVLYVRMFFTMAVTLYTSRVVLATLGVEDYGVYNVVGGIVAMFGFISGSLSAASQRYITFELGKGKGGNLSKVFSIALQLHIVLAIGIAIIAEPIGIWFIANKLMIPEGRLTAALWVYQFSIISMVILFISVPLNGLIIAYERMSAFALVSIVDVALKLVIAFSLLACKTLDKLIIYGLLMLAAQLINSICYTVYCKRNFKSCKFSLIFDKNLMKEMGSFASWSILGNIAYMTYTQGLNLLLGTFFLPFVNAARGIAIQVQGAVNVFVAGFQTAVNPQITKNYAAGYISEMVALVFRSSKFSFYLLMILTIPVILQADLILGLWLKNVPTYTVPFLRVILLTTWINSIANPLIISVKATGNVKLYEGTVGGLMILILPISYVFLRLGYPPITVFIVHLAIECIAMAFRIWNTKRLIGFSIRQYTKEVIFRIFIVAITACIIPIVLQIYLDKGILNSIIIVFVSLFCSGCSILFWGLTKGERAFILSKIKR